MRRYLVPLLMVIVSIYLSACVSDPRTMWKTEIQTNISDFHYDPQKWIVPSEQTITITFDIPDGTSHLFAILRTQIPGGMDLSAENLFWSFSLTRPHITASFKAPAMPGEYIVTCLTPGHNEKGEIGQLIVVMPYSSPAP